MRFATARSVWDVVAPDTPFFDAMFRSGDGHRWAYSHPLAATLAVSCMTFASACAGVFGCIYVCCGGGSSGDTWCVLRAK